ncbi:FimV/HubP family polar landmark protein [Bordetella genomosp. 11]|nr:FimV/HubP family polar landmark protein [Bordetella genomosp. 11]
MQCPADFTEAHPGAAGSCGRMLIKVAASDTTFGIAQRYRQATGADICQIAVALWQANPHAFERNDMNLLKRGSEVELPDGATIRAIDPEAARRTCGAHIDPSGQQRKGTEGMTIRQSFEEQRDLQAGDRELVYFGDTLGQIAKRLQIPGATQHQKLVAIAKANADAFSRGNMNDLRTGVVLRMPDVDEVHAIDDGASQGGDLPG